LKLAGKITVFISAALALGIWVTCRVV